MTAEQIMQKLAAPFPACDVEWRVQNTTQDKSRGMAVPFIDSRAIQNRLDSVVGIYNWKTEYRPWHQVEKGDKERKAKQDGTPKEVNASQLCGLSIYCEERKEWVPKWDGAETQISNRSRAVFPIPSNGPPSYGTWEGISTIWTRSGWILNPGAGASPSRSMSLNGWIGNMSGRSKRNLGQSLPAPIAAPKRPIPPSSRRLPPTKEDKRKATPLILNTPSSQ